MTPYTRQYVESRRSDKPEVIQAALNGELRLARDIKTSDLRPLLIKRRLFTRFDAFVERTGLPEQLIPVQEELRNLDRILGLEYIGTHSDEEDAAAFLGLLSVLLSMDVITWNEYLLVLALGGFLLADHDLPLDEIAAYLSELQTVDAAHNLRVRAAKGYTAVIDMIDAGEADWAKLVERFAAESAGII